jgi:uncharacterized protein (DUF4415 family)
MDCRVKPGNDDKKGRDIGKYMSAEEEYIVRLLVTLPDGTSIIEHPDGRLERQRSRTDWAKVDALTDEEIEAAMRDDPDWADLIDMDWSDAVLVVPETRPVVLNLDWDVFEFFERQGPGYQTRINAVLRRFMEKVKKADAAE